MPVPFEVGSTGYLWIKALHVVAIITWMAGLFYLPRLFVYHADAPTGSDRAETFKVMERRLLKAIMNPSMIVVFVSGFLLFPAWMTDGWMHAKLLLVLLMAGFHGFCGRWRRELAEDRSRRSAKFFRIANEVPTVLLLGIVILVIVKPF